MKNLTKAPCRIMFQCTCIDSALGGYNCSGERGVGPVSTVDDYCKAKAGGS